MYTLEDVEKIVDEMQKPQKTDFNSVINNLHIKSLKKSRIFILICHLVSLAVIRPVLEVDVQVLEKKNSSMAIEKAIKFFMYQFVIKSAINLN